MARDARRTYKWCELAGSEVAALTAETDVALLPIGCVEMHGPHLPTGTDAIIAEAIAERAAALEPAIILPTLYYNLNDEMACYPGTIAISPEVLARLYEEVFCEAARNGFHRIVLLNGHGGSEEVTRFVQHSLLHRRVTEARSIAVFEISLHALGEALQGVLDTAPTQQGHGCERETALVLDARPDLVHLERLPPLPGGEGPQRGQAVPSAWYVVDWIRRVPRGYIGRPHLATAAKGQALAEAIASACAQAVAQIKGLDLLCDP